MGSVLKMRIKLSFLWGLFIGQGTKTVGSIEIKWDGKDRKGTRVH